MVGKGIQYGYVYTGQAFVFLRIPDNPTIVYYYMCMPNQNGLDDEDTPSSPGVGRLACSG